MTLLEERQDADGMDQAFLVAARAVARRHPHWRYRELAGVGHVPQLQVPDALTNPTR